jgi:hypothetical protein
LNEKSVMFEVDTAILDESITLGLCLISNDIKIARNNELTVIMIIAMAYATIMLSGS